MKNLFYSLVLICFCFTSYGQLIINKNTTWTTNQVLTQSVIIQQGYTLTINPGVLVKVLFIDNNSDLIGDVKIEVKGSLNVLGHPCNKVNFIPYITTTNKQYWSGIELDTLATNCSISNASIQNANIGIKIENTSASINDVEIINAKVNGIYAFGTNANLTLTNSLIMACDGEGLSITDASVLNINNSKVKLNGSSGLKVVSVQNVSIANSVIYNNGKSGIFLNSSTANIRNSVLRKNVRMGLILSNSSLTCDKLDIDSNSVDGMFVGGSSTLTMTNSSLKDNTGFGIETSEYIFNSDFGNIGMTNLNPNVSINSSNFIGNHKTSTVISTTDINGSGSYPFQTGESKLDSYCNQKVFSNCAYGLGYAWPPFLKTCWGYKNPAGIYDWINFITIEVPFGMFGGFSGNVGRRNTFNTGSANVRPRYGAFEEGASSPFWTHETPSNGYEGCQAIDVGFTANNDRITLSGGLVGVCNGSSFSQCSATAAIGYKFDSFKFKVGGYNYRSLINATSVTDVLTGNFWDTIVPTAVTNSVGAVLNLNGFEISEILSAHSNLTNSFINSNSINFQILQNTPLFCSGGTNILIAPSGNYTYQWTNNGIPITNNNDSLTVNSNGNYAVSLTGTCAANSSTISVVVSTGSPIAITPSGPTSFCAGNSVTLTSPSATGNFWSNGSLTQSITVNNSGTYSLTVSNPQVCPSVSSPIQVVVISPTPPVISSSGSTTVCQNGVVELTSNLSSNLIWSNTKTTQKIIVSTSGTYSAQITSNGCTSLPSNTIQVNVIANPNTTVTPSGPTSFCQGNSVALNALLESGNTYQWYNSGLLIPSAISNVYNATSSGNYTVFISKGNCSSTSSPLVVAVTAIPVAPIISASGNTTICQGENVTLNANLSNVVWSNNELTPSITVNQSGSFSAITINNGCVSPPSNQISLVVNPLPEIPVITASGPTSFCQGNSLALNVLLESGNTYQWYNNGLLIPSETSNVYNVNSNGNYTVFISKSNCSSTSSPLVVTVNTIPEAPIISVSGPTTFCVGNSLTITQNYASGVTWTVSNGQKLSQPSVKVTGNAQGVYDITANVTVNGCTSVASQTIKVVVNPLPQIPLITSSGPTTFCIGSSVILNSSSSIGNSWSTNQTTSSITVLNSGNYTVKVTDLNGCYSVSLPLAVIVNTTPTTPVISANGPTSFCAGNSVTLTSPSATGNFWSNGSLSQSITVNNSGTYTVKVTKNGCTSATSQPISTTVLPNGIPSFNQVAPICAGSTFILPSTSNNGYSGSWTPAINKTTTTTYTFNPLSGVCVTSQKMTVTVNSLPQVTLSSFTKVCNTGTNLVLSGGTPIGGTYTGTSVMSNSFNPSIGIGTYPITYTYTNGSGCSSSANQNLTVITCTAEIKDLSNQLIQIYPNPICDILYINSEIALFSSFELIDNQGRIVLSDELKGTKTSLNIESLAPGNYYLKIEERNILVKVVKQ